MRHEKVQSLGKQETTNADEACRQKQGKTKIDKAISFLSIYLKDSISAHQIGAWTLAFTV